MASRPTTISSPRSTQMATRSSGAPPARADDGPAGWPAHSAPHRSAPILVHHRDRTRGPRRLLFEQLVDAPLRGYSAASRSTHHATWRSAAAAAQSCDQLIRMSATIPSQQPHEGSPTRRSIVSARTERSHNTKCAGDLRFQSRSTAASRSNLAAA